MLPHCWNWNPSRICWKLIHPPAKILAMERQDCHKFLTFLENGSVMSVSVLEKSQTVVAVSEDLSGFKSAKLIALDSKKENARQFFILAQESSSNKFIMGFLDIDRGWLSSWKTKLLQNFYDPIVIIQDHALMMMALSKPLLNTSSDSGKKIKQEIHFFSISKPELRQRVLKRPRLEELLHNYDNEIVGAVFLGWLFLLYKKFIYQKTPPFVDPEVWSDPMWNDPRNVKMLYETIRDQVLDKENPTSYGVFGSAF